jgi:hypothetical protein
MDSSAIAYAATLLADRINLIKNDHVQLRCLTALLLLRFGIFKKFANLGRIIIIISIK